MAVEEPDSIPKRKGKNDSGDQRKKLAVNESVEVRSMEEGFLGSWHPGIVVVCGNKVRHVKYDNILLDDGSDTLVDTVAVSPVLDGCSFLKRNRPYKRGYIRPLPPPLEIGAYDLHYGLCVDVNYQEAWWEGVIFDHCDGNEERSIFFPDLADELKVGIDKMRITQDWDEVTENWQRRGNWVFLELIEEYGRRVYIAVSVKQMWYDLRAKDEFGKICEWTYNEKKLWKLLVLEVINDYVELTLNELFPLLDLSQFLLDEALELEPTALTVVGDMNHEVELSNSRAILVTNSIIPLENLHTTGKDDDQGNNTRLSYFFNKFSEILPEQDTVRDQEIRECQRRPKNNFLHLVSGDLQRIPLLHTISKGKLRCERKKTPRLKRKRFSGNLTKEQEDIENNCNMWMLRSSKRVRLVCNPKHRNPRTVLSWLIENSVVLPRAKVQYRDTPYGITEGQGRITHNGIKCACCKEVLTLSSFKYHVKGSGNRIPAANIFFEDGRSLLECQKELINVPATRVEEPSHRDKVIEHQDENDYICSICHYGGELILCDQCPSAFHKDCLGLEVLPDGDWFCLSCRCRVCQQGKFKDEIDDGSFQICNQCEHKYHTGCIRNTGAFNFRRYHNTWFCCESCEQIYLGLYNLLGKATPISVNNLTLTVMKSVNTSSSCLLGCDTDYLIESHSKLNIALAVMHECFEPLKESRTGMDIFGDVIFSRWSDLKRLNFQGFFIALLEKNDELISLATVRVYGEKVAEVSLVGTRFQYRQLGMCRILMKEIERMLINLGVKRLVLPAVPSMLRTWTNSFGFSEMTKVDRLQLLDYVFLEFQDSIMCQKLLSATP